jgi:hypothetical protein
VDFDRLHLETCGFVDRDIIQQQPQVVHFFMRLCPS